MLAFRARVGLAPMTRIEKSEAARILDLYRRLVLLGLVHLPFDIARRLVGPDRAYHLYGRTKRRRRWRGRRSRSPLPCRRARPSRSYNTLC